MKASTHLLCASVGLNAALLGAIAFQVATGQPAAVPAKAVPTVSPTTTLTATPGPDTWSSLAAKDLAAERDRLRAEGFPDRLIRAILAAQLRDQYAAQRKALAGGAVQPYWKNAKPDAATTAALRDLSRAERKELRDLLGADAPNGAADTFKAQIPNLSPEKAAALADIQDRYNEKRQELYAGGPIMSADARKIYELEQAMHAEFAAVLTPQELESYDLRASRTAQQMQYNLAAFDPTEDEFRTLYKLQSAFDNQYGPYAYYGQTTTEEAQARAQAQKQLQDDIAAALGTDRYAQYQRATDYNYRQTSQLVARLELPPETADNLYAVQKEYQQKRQDAFKSVSATSFEDIQKQMTTMQQEATARVSTVLNGDPRAIEAYKTYGGQWLQQMVPTRSVGAAPGVTRTTTIIRSGP